MHSPEMRGVPASTGTADPAEANVAKHECLEPSLLQREDTQMGCHEQENRSAEKRAWNESPSRQMMTTFRSSQGAVLRKM